MSRSSIVVTGAGIVSPLGTGVQAVWDRLIAGESGIRPLDRFDVSALSTKFAGQVPSIKDDPHGFNPDDVMSTKDQRKVDLFILYAMKAAQEALEQANWVPETEIQKQRTGTVIATGVGGFPSITLAKETLDARGPRRISPFTVPSFLANLAAGQVSIRFGLKGPIGAPVTACAAGIQAIGDAARIILSGEADVVLAGGTEACIDPLSLAGFGAARALSKRNDAPQDASRPFDQDRDGFVMGEGAGLLVLESREHAEQRGATILCNLAGYGTSADAHHITSGPEDGSGAARAIRIALAQAGLEPDNIDYVNAHATSTHVGDRGEIAALRSIFGDHLPNVPVSSTKSATGHLLGAAGGIEAIFSLMALKTGILPPTLNLHNPDSDIQDLDFVPLKSREHQVNAVLSNGFGFGGVNASICLTR
ncbi:MAG: beta-ketoacyl-ACP synthase II [Cohaesibacteraceae bacterium]|nr:beta-ketoacyl-ACP synthase II [Cohaesibacteraceae bacterium]